MGASLPSVSQRRRVMGETLSRAAASWTESVGCWMTSFTWGINEGFERFFMSEKL